MNTKRVLGISFVAIFAIMMIFPQIAIASDDPQNTNPNSSDQETAGSTIELTVAGRGDVPVEEQAIPDWVKNQFDWYLKGEIDEKTLLTSMNWMFDNNIMFLSEKAATEVNELKIKVSHLEDLLSTSEQHKIDSESGTIRFGDGVHGSIPPSGEPVAYSCDGMACSCDGSACWDLKSEGKCHEDKLWCEDHEDDSSYSCVCWEKTTAGMSLVDFDEIKRKDTATSTGERIMQSEYGVGASDNSAISRIAIVDVPSTIGVPYKIFIVGGVPMDINSLIQDVLRESDMETNEDLQYYADKVRYYNNLKDAIRDENQRSQELLAHELTHSIQQDTNPADDSDTDEFGRIKVQFPWMSADSDFASKIVDDILRKGGTTSAWGDGIAAFSQHGMRESVIPELAGIVVLCNNAIDKKTQQIDSELKIIEQWLDIISEKQESESYDASGRLTSEITTESTAQYNESDLDFITGKLASIDQQIKALDTGIMVLEEKLSGVGDDAQLANIDLQNSLQKQQQTLQTISNVSKMLHDTAKSIIQNMRA